MTSVFMEHQYALAYPDGIENHWWHLTRNRVVLEEIKKLATPASTVLDVGCGRGIAVQYLRNQGVDCRGVELATTKALVGVGEHVRFGVTATELPLEERARYNILLLLDVIEHLPDPVTVLASLVTGFPRLSHIVVTVPARPELWSNYDEFYGHRRRYTARMIDKLADQLGCDLAFQRYYFRPLYLPARVLAVLKKERSTKMDAPRGLTKAVHRLISYAMVIDYHALPGRVPGTGIVACFRLPRGPAHKGPPADADGCCR